jgi:hypothetical protein
MSNLITTKYNNVAISTRDSDGWVNLTQMCQADGVKFNDFLRLKSTKAYVSSMVADTGIPASQIIEVVKVSKGSFQTEGNKEVGDTLRLHFC